MKRSIIKRFLTFCLLFIMLSNTTITVFATAEATPSNSNEFSEEYASVTYNPASEEILYGIDQNIASESDIELIIEESDVAVYANNVVPGVLGKEDQRTLVTNTTVHPYCSICFIEVWFPNGNSYAASGTLVYKNVLLTAGHNVYNNAYGGWATKIQVTPGRIGYNNYPFGQSWAKQWTTNEGWTQHEDRNWDWAIVDLNSEFSNWHQFGYYKDYNSQTGKNVRTIGYPLAKGQRMHENVNIVKTAGDRYMHILCDISEGDSGGAVINEDNSVLVGIISAMHHNILGQSDYNVAVRLNEDLCNRIKAHMK